MSEETIAFDSVLDLCQSQHRRIILGILIEEPQSVTLDDLTKAVLKYNHQTPITEVSDDLLAKIRTSFYHVHLPKLAAEGLIIFDPEHQLVEPTDQLEQARPTLSTILDADPTLNTPIEL